METHNNYDGGALSRRVAQGRVRDAEERVRAAAEEGLQVRSVDTKKQNFVSLFVLV